MGVYARFKRDDDGFRKLVELLETTPMSRRQKMIDVGMQEDADYTRKALEYVMTFEDITQLPDSELAEVCAKAPPKMLAYALSHQKPEVVERFLRCSPPHTATEVRDLIDVKVGPREITGAEIKIVETARDLERKGFVRVKKIPPNSGLAVKAGS